MKQPCVYILASQRNGILYAGVTSNLIQRVHNHRAGVTEGFTTKYECKLLVYYEFSDDMPSAIRREKQLKAGSRAKKIELITRMNPLWKDLYPEIAAL